MSKLYKKKPLYVKAEVFQLGMEHHIHISDSGQEQYFIKGVHDNYLEIKPGDYIVTYHDGDLEVLTPEQFTSEFDPLCNGGREYADHIMGNTLVCLDCVATEADLIALKNLDNLR